MTKHRCVAPGLPSLEVFGGIHALGLEGLPIRYAFAPFFNVGLGKRIGVFCIFPMTIPSESAVFHSMVIHAETAIINDACYGRGIPFFGYFFSE